jgi:hypothetical protein
MDATGSSPMRERLLQLVEMLEQHIAAKQSEPELGKRYAREPTDRLTAQFRQTRRGKIEEPGRVILNGWPLEMACLITDLRLAGARLQLPCIFTLPETFSVVIVSRQTTFLCTKIWQRGVEVGVGFTDVQPRAV